MAAIMPEEKKLIIDEDWKAQVQAEKAEAQQAAAPHETPPETGSRTVPPHDFEMPPASWELLLTTLATEAMVSLPGAGRLPPSRPCSLR